MEDKTIVALYWARKEEAIEESKKKYGRYCAAVAGNILPDRLDREECVSDTWLRAWNAMPEDKPDRLGAYLAAITRRLALDQWNREHAAKRGGGQTALALEELAECIPAAGGPEQALEEGELTAALDRFLRGLEADKRIIFVQRYWYLQPVAAIAKDRALGQSAVKMNLHRLRQQLAEHLRKEGFAL